LLVGVRFNQAGIHRKSFTADQPAAIQASTTRSNYAPEDAAIAKPLVAGARECGVIRDFVLN
jgi:hypothetical protein